MKTINMKAEQHLDSDELKYLIKKLTKIQGFDFVLDMSLYHIEFQYHAPKKKVTA